MERIILTGASDGLGKAFGELCVKNDIKIIALCRTKPEYECEFIKVDLSNEKEIIEACNKIKEKYKKFDALINCAGINVPEKIDKITYSCLENLMKINSIAPMFLTSQLINLIKENSADIINIGSTVGIKQGYIDQLAYTTSKYAIRGTSYNLQLELKPYNCRVIQFNVGGMNTRILEKTTGNKIENPNEWMQPSDIAELMLYFLNLPKKIEISEITLLVSHTST